MLYVAQDRKQSSLDGFWATLTPEQIGAVDGGHGQASVGSTCREAARSSSTRIAQHLGGAVDKVRRKENKILRADGDDTLVGTRFGCGIRHGWSPKTGDGLKTDGL